MKMKKILAFIFAFAILSTSVKAQETRLTREQIMAMSIEELSDLPLEDLMQAVETLGVSSVDELFALIMNKNVASASKKEEDAFSSPLSSTTLTRAEIQKFGANTIEEALKLIPGVVVQQKTNGNYDVIIRGLNNIPDNQMLLYTENANTLLMVNGRVCHNYAIGNVCFDMLPVSLADIERIEVVRGATSALYGTNAVQGVINIITTKPNATEYQTSGSFAVGTSGTAYGNVAFNQAINNKIALGMTIGLQHTNRWSDKVYVMPNDNLQYEGDPTSPVSFAGGGWVKPEELHHIKYIEEETNVITDVKKVHHYDIIEPSIKASDMFKDINTGRRQATFNFYSTFTPTDKVEINLQAGYQNSLAACSPVSDDFFSLNYRTSKTAYVNLDANIENLHVNANYSQGPQNFAIGVKGFKEKSKVFSAQASYDIELPFELSVRPEVYYQNVKYEDYDEKGYFNGDAQITNIAPSLRLDYQHNGWRFIGAFRSDKTNIPDKWNNSWQVAASKLINSDNFVRLSYSRAMRSANLTNTSANYTWDRETLPQPQAVLYIGNEEADIMHIDNFELGYRMRPSDRILIDAEMFYSKSSDYGALHSQSSRIFLENDQLTTFITNLVMAWSEQMKAQTAGQQSTALDAFIKSEIGNVNEKFGSQATIQYQNLPYEVHQGGITLGIDWIISPKVIAKINLNGQQTFINNYYSYNQNSSIREQLATSRYTTLANLIGYDHESKTFSDNSFVREFVADLTTCALEGRDYIKYAQDAKHHVPNLANIQMANDKDGVEIYKMAYERATIEGFNILYGMENVPLFELDGYESAWFDPADIKTNHYLAAYYGLKYDIRSDGNVYYFATQPYKRPELSNKHKHKATPSFYGSIGLVYKPVKQLEVATNMSFIGKREYETMYGFVELDAKFNADLKVSYSPMSNISFYFNGQNIFNNTKVASPYGDKTQGTYMAGVMFGF